MEKPKSVHKQRLRTFKMLRALAVAALICTVLLTVFILIESALPGSASGIQSDLIGDAIQSVTGKDDAELDSALSAFGSFSRFIRKGLGHFLLFALLGFGWSMAAFFLFRPRALFAVISAVAGTVTAIISEAFQLPVFTTGRVASWQDVGIDAFGAVCGTAFASAVILLYAIIKKTADKNGYSAVKEVLPTLSIATACKRDCAIMATAHEEYSRQV